MKIGFIDVIFGYVILLREWICFKSNLLIVWYKGGRGESVCYVKKVIFFIVFYGLKCVFFFIF